MPTPLPHAPRMARVTSPHSHTRSTLESEVRRLKDSSEKLADDRAKFNQQMEGMAKLAVESVCRPLMNHVFNKTMVAHHLNPRTPGDRSALCAVARNRRWNPTLGQVTLFTPALNVPITDRLRGRLPRMESCRIRFNDTFHNESSKTVSSVLKTYGATFSGKDEECDATARKYRAHLTVASHSSSFDEEILLRWDTPRNTP